MPERLNRAVHYRFQAEKLRTIAQDYIDADAMMMLAELAWQYEKMADDLEKAAKADGINLR